MEATVIDPDVVISFWQDQTAGRASSNRFLLCSVGTSGWFSWWSCLNRPRDKWWRIVSHYGCDDDDDEAWSDQDGTHSPATLIFLGRQPYILGTLPQHSAVFRCLSTSDSGRSPVFELLPELYYLHGVQFLSDFSQRTSHFSTFDRYPIHTKRQIPAVKPVGCLGGWRSCYRASDFLESGTVSEEEAWD